MVKRDRHGFTLTEFIIVIVIIAIVSIVIGPLLTGKFAAVSQAEQRAAWVQQAELAFFHLRQDLYRSVPNSLFTSEPSAGADQVVEFLAADSEQELLAARYRYLAVTSFDALDVSSADSAFDIFATATSAPDYVSIGLTSAAEARLDWQGLQSSTSSARQLAAVQSIASILSENGTTSIGRVTLTAGHQFKRHSPYYRAYFFTGPLGYYCDADTNLLYRVSGYSSLATSADFAARSEAASFDRVIDNVQGCSFSFSDGSGFTAPSLRVMLEIGNGSESIRLIDTIRLSNGS